MIALSLTFAVMPLYVVSGQISVSIINIIPTSQSAKVGDRVQILGSLGTANGTYKIWFGNTLVVTNNSQGYYVDSSFRVPELPAGNHTITLNDVTKNVNSTKSFTVLTDYSIKAEVPSSPVQLQQGSNVILNVGITGAQANTTYYVNVTVALPEPLNTHYSRIIELRTSPTGAARAAVTYPDGSFQPSGASTNLTGTYRVYFNMTQSLAENSFFVGFTDTSEHHRGQSVAIRAIDYQPSQEAALTIVYTKTSVTVHSETLTASSEGVITAAWAVPSNALIGEYNVTIKPVGAAKLLVDSQIFTVPGYPVKIRTLNLAGEAVPQLMVEAVDHATNMRYNGTGNVDGVATINLEVGNHTVSAFWNNVKVGDASVVVTGANAFDLQCKLTNLKVTVQDKNGVLLPFATIDLVYQYVTTKEGLTKTGRVSGQTGISGTVTFNSTLPGISYTVNASIYGVVFNTGNNTVSSLPAQPTFHITIVCPSRSLALKIVDYKSAVVPNARVELVEQTSGIFVNSVADASGAVTMEITFGKYRLRVYAGNILLNETVISVFTDAQRTIRCVLYNLHVSVRVVDSFGQAVPNVNVLLRGSEQEALLKTTQADGTATFDHVVGGNLQIIAYLSGDEASYEATNLQIEAPTTITIRLAKYVLLGPFVLEATFLMTLIMIAAAAVLFVFMEIRRRKQIKLGWRLRL
ncbi:MAG: carboxypeptidase-like regulatory domain-containing protein [Candidatus Bathyarchaeota archaeon]|nr:carboxypeptidase-like regulatory domain-containing protein [Candidatus Bathyarchaeota archaeon]